MSFTAEVKNEICKGAIKRDCCALAEIYGFLLFANSFHRDSIRMHIENKQVLTRVVLLFRRVFGFSPKVVTSETTGKSVVTVEKEEERRRVLALLSYDFKHYISMHISRNVLENDCCTLSFLKGVFLSGGTVASPEKNYHLEIRSSHTSLVSETLSIMLDNELYPRLSRRKTSALIYFKDSSGIESFLTKIGAPLSSFALMEAKLEKDLINNVNRKVNCENANISKTVEASAQQNLLLRRAIAVHGIEGFAPKHHETIRLRMEHPEASFAELAALMGGGLTKAGMSHRLKKIVESAQTLLGEKTKET